MSRLAHVIQAFARHEVERRTYCELAVVTSVFDGDDGQDAHCVSVKLKDSDLPLPKLPLASGLTGAAALPREGDVVVVVFPRGDLSSGVVLSQVYADERRPPPFTRDEAALVWPGDSDDPEAKAVELRIRADGSKREVKIVLGGDKDAQVSLTDGVLELKSGGVQLKLSHTSSSDGALELTAGGTRIRLDQDGDLTVEAAQTLTLKGAKVAIEGDSQVTINGQTVEIN